MSMLENEILAGEMNFPKYKPENQKDEYKAEDRKSRSELGPAGFTYTHRKGHQWCMDQLKLIREKLGDDLKDSRIYIWGYRFQEGENLSFDVISNRLQENGLQFGMSFTIQCIGEYSGLEYQDVCVPDMTEALHLVGIMTRSLNLPVSFGLGRNEINPEVLETPLQEKQTSGNIKLG